MVNSKNEHVFPKDGGWIVKREASKKVPRLFENKEDAIEYAGMTALNNGGSVVTHKYNGQFKNFKNGNEIFIQTNKIVPTTVRTIEIIHPIVNNTQPIVETITSI